MTHSVGIDLGTTNSVVARVVGSEPAVLSTDTGQTVVPSVVGFRPDEENAMVGRQAVNYGSVHPERITESVKRRMGEEEPAAVVNGTEYLPEEISALILTKLKHIAEQNLGSSVTNAVITVPADFINRQREATERAAKLAGLSLDRLINEPTAAMLAHGIRSQDDTTALVYDLGGGTFDVSIVEAGNGVFEVLATDGVTHHGGDDWDARLVGQIRKFIEEEADHSIEDNSRAMRRIWDTARDAKHDLASSERTEISIPHLLEAEPDYTFQRTLTRSDFQEMTADLMDKTVEKCEDVLNEAGIQSAAIDEVLLVGGSTRMPQVEERLERKFGDLIRRSGSPDEVVAKGAAIQAAKIQESLPVVRDSGSKTLKKREQQSIGAETESEYALPEVYDDVILIDVIAESLGTMTKGDNFAPIIDGNTSIPVEETELFVTSKDNQTKVNVKIYQGESATASENELLDEFVFSGLPKLPAGEAEIYVTFRVNENGILEVTVESGQKGHTDGIRIDQNIEFSERELEKMQADLPELREKAGEYQ